MLALWSLLIMHTTLINNIPLVLLRAGRPLEHKYPFSFASESQAAQC
jgi:hypothetical protein